MNLLASAKTTNYPRGLASTVARTLVEKCKPEDRISKVEAESALRKIVMKNNERPTDFSTDSAHSRCSTMET